MKSSVFILRWLFLWKFPIFYTGLDIHFSSCWIFTNCFTVFVDLSVAALQWWLGDRSGQRHAEERRQDGWGHYSIYFAWSSHGKPGGLSLHTGRRWCGMICVNENLLKWCNYTGRCLTKIPLTPSFHRACSTCMSTRPSTETSKAITSCWRHKEGSNSWTLVRDVPHPPFFFFGKTFYDAPSFLAPFVSNQQKSRYGSI